MAGLQQVLASARGHDADPLCAGCGSWFAPVRKGQRYCRPSCRALAEWHDAQARAARAPLLPLEAPAGPRPTTPEPERPPPTLDDVPF